MTNSTLAQVAALKQMAMAALKERWRELYGTEPPGYNRRFLESRLAYRIQEVAYGGLSRATLERLEALGEQFAVDGSRKGRRPANDRPIAGTQFVRDWQGVEHRVTVRENDFEYQGRPYKSLSAIARAITGTRWNGLIFFGIKNHKGRL